MKTTILTLLSIFLLNGCDKDSTKDPIFQLPPETQTGANTFGAIINGKVMIPRNSKGYIPPGSNHYAARYQRSEDWEKISASDSRTNTGGIYIYIQNENRKYPLNIGEYKIGNSAGQFADNYSDNTLVSAYLQDSNDMGKTYLSIENTGIITIKKSDENIISGTFSCRLKYEKNSKDIIEIKNGRFDFNKNTINTTNFP